MSVTELSRKWTVAQARERTYYEQRASSGDVDHEQTYAHSHADFWQGILKRIPEVSFEDSRTYVDVGCGPNSILTFAERGQCTGIDPLMDFYIENFKLPAHVTFHKGKIEDLAPIEERSADVIFSMNNIDHVEDLSVASKTIRRKLKDDGLLVVSVNVVQGKPVIALSRVFDVYKIIDPTHTYHFHSVDEVADAFEGEFELVRHESVEDLSEAMASVKRQRDPSRGLTQNVRRFLKYIKNDLLLKEDLQLLLFKPKKVD